MNSIWLALMSGSVLFAAFHGTMAAVLHSALQAAEAAVLLAIHLAGIMSLWLGMMKIAEKAGMVELIARVASPVLGFLFPGIPRRHPALGAVVMTLAANLLGMGNAATPLGINAMRALQQLNPQPQRPSPDMCTLTVLCAAGFTLVPATMIAVRASAGSANPAVILIPTIIVGLTVTLIVVVADRVCRLLLADRRWS